MLGLPSIEGIGSTRVRTGALGICMIHFIGFIWGRGTLFHGPSVMGIPDGEQILPEIQITKEDSTGEGSLGELHGPLIGTSGWVDSPNRRSHGFLWT